MIAISEPMDNIDRIQELAAFFDRTGFSGYRVIETNQMVRCFIPKEQLSNIFETHLDELACFTRELGYLVFTIHPD